MNPDEQTQEVIQPKQPLPIFGKDEMNLAEFPIAKLGRKDKREFLEYEGWVVDKDGQRHQQKWVVRSAAGLGLPTEFAERIMVALITLTAKENFQNRKVAFTIYRILKLLDLSLNKRNYQAVKKALKQLVGITIYSEGAFWDKHKQRRITTLKGFHLIDDIWLKSMEDDEAVIEAEGVNGYIVWGERIWDSFKEGYIKNLDVEFYYSLNNAVARRLFRFLDKRMHYQDEYQIDIFDVAGRLGLAKYRYPSEVKKKLKPGLDELIERGFLDSAETVKVSKYTRVKFVKASTSYDREQLQNSVLTPPDADSEPFKSKDDQDAIADSNTPWRAIYEQYDTPSEYKETWAMVIGELEQSVVSDMSRLVHNTALLSIENGTALIGVAGEGKDWIENRLGRQIKVLLNIHLECQIDELTFVSV